MDVETSKKLAKKLGSHIDEFAMAVAAIEWVQLGEPDRIVGTITKTYLLMDISDPRDVTAGEYLTKRDLWDLVK